MDLWDQECIIHLYSTNLEGRKLPDKDQLGKLRQHISQMYIRFSSMDQSILGYKLRLYSIHKVHNFLIGKGQEGRFHQHKGQNYKLYRCKDQEFLECIFLLCNINSEDMKLLW